MLKRTLIAVLAVLVGTVVVSAIEGQRHGLVPGSLGQDSKLFDGCGLDKLSDLERSNLFRLVQCMPTRSYLEESAMRFVENDRWKEAEVYGTQSLKFGIDIRERPYLIAYAEGKAHILEPPFSLDDIPMPGVYWSKFEGSRIVLINREGKKQDFWIKRSE